MKEADVHCELSRLLERERPRLLRFFARRPELRESAEDLVQETCIEAWRLRGRLRPEGASAAWILGVARNVALRGRRRSQRQLRRRGELSAEPVDERATPERALESEELGGVLSQALERLSPPTRELLVARYLDDVPIAELADRRGLSENAVTVRLHRGRQLLQRTFLTDFRQTALEMGWTSAQETPWQETRIWCAGCGARHLLGQPPEHGEDHFRLRCPACHGSTCFFTCTSASAPLTREALRVRGFGRRLYRLDAAYHRLYLPYLSGERADCPDCGHPVCTTRQSTDAGTLFGVNCTRCDAAFDATLGRFLMGMAPVQSFWKANPRMRRRPERTVSLEGVPAIEVVYESVTSTGRLSVLCRADRFAILKVA